MHVERQQVYVPDNLVREAREKGISNLSKFVRVKLEEYNRTHEIRKE
jgi:post-segregation antitoxin (ccd killing protein)